MKEYFADIFMHQNPSILCNLREDGGGGGGVYDITANQPSLLPAMVVVDQVWLPIMN